MFAWFQTCVEHAFLRRFHESDAVLAKAQQQLADLRTQLYGLYMEVELAMAAVDQLGGRVDAARQRVRARQQVLTPETFTNDHRQRDTQAVEYNPNSIADRVVDRR